MKARKQPVYYRSSDGGRYLIADMPTQQLFNTYRKLFNHIVPPAFRVGRFIRRAELFGWSTEYKGALLTELGRVLGARLASLTEAQQYELYDMNLNHAFLRSTGYMK